MRELNIRTTEITDHVLVLLSRASAFHHDVVARLVVTPVVADDRYDRHVVSRHGPEGIGLPEQKAAVALKRDYLIIRTRELDSDRGAHAPAQRATERASDLCLLAFGERKRTQYPVFRPNLFNDDRIVVEHFVKCQEQPWPRQRAFVPTIARGSHVRLFEPVSKVLCRRPTRLLDCRQSLFRHR